MLFSAIGTLAAIASLASAAPQPGAKVALLTVHSASPLQYASIFVDETNSLVVQPGSSNSAVGTWKGDGSIEIDGQFISYIDNKLVLAPQGHSTAIFSYETTETNVDFLTFQESEFFWAVTNPNPNKNSYLIEFTPDNVNPGPGPSNLGIKIIVSS